jgi:hypothetical protein
MCSKKSRRILKPLILFRLIIFLEGRLSGTMLAFKKTVEGYLSVSRVFQFRYKGRVFQKGLGNEQGEGYEQG